MKSYKFTTRLPPNRCPSEGALGERSEHNTDMCGSRHVQSTRLQRASVPPQLQRRIDSTIRRFLRTPERVTDAIGKKSSGVEGRLAALRGAVKLFAGVTMSPTFPPDPTRERAPEGARGRCGGRRRSRGQGSGC